MRLESLLLFLGMGVVTYIPRALPSLFLNKLHFGKKFEKFLRLIPYTAMASMIFPGVFNADPRWYVVVAGVLAAMFLGYKKMPVAVTVLGSIAVVMVINFIAL